MDKQTKTEIALRLFEFLDRSEKYPDLPTLLLKLEQINPKKLKNLTEISHLGSVARLGGDADDGDPVFAFGKLSGWKKRVAHICRNTGYEVLKYVTFGLTDDDLSMRPYNKVISAVSFFPSGTDGEIKTPGNLVNLDDVRAWNMWMSVVDKAATIIGYKILKKDDYVKYLKKTSVQSAKGTEEIDVWKDSTFK